MIVLMIEFIYYYYLIIDREEKIPLTWWMKNKNWIDINIDGEDKTAIAYDYVPLRILLVTMIVTLKLI